MKYLAILITFLLYIPVQSQTDPCDCDCDEILEGKFGQDNKLPMYKVGNCYNMEVNLTTCGDRTINGFNLDFLESGCLENETIDITDISDFGSPVYLGSYDFYDVEPDDYFPLNPPLTPCQTRTYIFELCFDDNASADDCLDEVYGVDITYEFGEGDDPCPSQVGQVKFGQFLSVDNRMDKSEYYIQGNVLYLDEKYSNSNVTIINYNGNIVNRQKYSTGLDLNSLPQGVYFITVDSGTKQLIRVNNIK